MVGSLFDVEEAGVEIGEVAVFRVSTLSDRELIFMWSASSALVLLSPAEVVPRLSLLTAAFFIRSVVLDLLLSLAMLFPFGATGVVLDESFEVLVAVSTFLEAVARSRSF